MNTVEEMHVIQTPVIEKPVIRRLESVIQMQDIDIDINVEDKKTEEPKVVEPKVEEKKVEEKKVEEKKVKKPKKSKK